MLRINKFLFLLVILLLTFLVSACGPQLTPVPASIETPTPIGQFVSDATEEPNLFMDLVPFRTALLQAIQSRDETMLEGLMAETFASGAWRGEMGDLSRADALRELYQVQLGNEIKLGEAASSELSALMGGINPLEIPRPEANVVDTIVVTGWGKDGKDEAILFVSRQPDNSLRWAGTMIIPGGFTSSATGGVQQLVNANQGYQVYLPLGYEVQRLTTDEISIQSPQGGDGRRVTAEISVEPADGRSVDQIVTELKATILADVASQTGTVINLDTEKALVFDRVPSQDLMRMLFVVHEDRLYRMIFIPQDESAGAAYDQMLNLYAVIVNTFKFIPVDSTAAPVSSGGKLVADPDVFIKLLQQALTDHDKVALTSMLEDAFTMAFWQSEGMQISPDEAVEQVLNNYVPEGAQPVLDRNHAVIARLFSEPLTTDAGEELIPVHVTGWGLEGKDEAVLFIARRDNGSLYWQGAMTALGGFGQ